MSVGGCFFEKGVLKKINVSPLPQVSCISWCVLCVENYRRKRWTRCFIYRQKCQYNPPTLKHQQRCHSVKKAEAKRENISTIVIFLPIFIKNRNNTWMLPPPQQYTHSIQYNGCRYKGQEFPVLKISAKIRVKAGNPVLNQSGIRVKEWDSLMIFAKKYSYRNNTSGMLRYKYPTRSLVQACRGLTQLEMGQSNLGGKGPAVKGLIVSKIVERYWK